MITEFRNEVKLYGKGKDLDVYIGNVFEYISKDYFFVPEYLYNKPLDNLTLLSLLVTSDIWTLRSSGFLSLISRRVKYNRISSLKSMNKWIELSKYIPVNAKFRNMLTKFCYSLSDKVKELKISNIGFCNLKKHIDNDAFYCFDEIQELLEKGRIVYWEEKNKHLLENKRISEVDMNTVLKVLREFPDCYSNNCSNISGVSNNNDICDNKCSDNTNNNSKMSNNDGSSGGSGNKTDIANIEGPFVNSKLFRFLTRINRKVVRFNNVLNKLVNNKVIDTDKLRYLMNKVDRELPKDSVLSRNRCKKILNYSVLVENRVGRELSMFFDLNKNWSDYMMIINNNFDNNSFSIYSNQLFSLENSINIIDEIISLKKFVEYVNKLKLNSNSSGTINDTNKVKYKENQSGYSIWSPKKSHFNHNSGKVKKGSTVYSDNMKNRYIYCNHFPRKLLSLKIRLMLSNIRKVKAWILDIDELCANYLECINNNRSISKQVCDNMGIRDKYLLFCSYFTDTENSKREKYFSKMRTININFERNKVILSKLRSADKYLKLRIEYENLEEFANKINSSNLSFSLILFFIDGVIRGIFRLLPEKSSISALLEKIKIYFALIDYFENNINKTSKLRVETIYLLRLYLDADNRDFDSDKYKDKDKDKDKDSKARRKMVNDKSCNDGLSVESVAERRIMNKMGFVDGSYNDKTITKNSVIATNTIYLNGFDNNNYLNKLVKDANDKMKMLLDNFVYHYNNILSVYLIIENIKADDESLILKLDCKQKLLKIMNYIIGNNDKIETVYDGICLFIVDDFNNSIANDKSCTNQFIIKDYGTISEYYDYLLNIVVNTNLGVCIKPLLIKASELDNSFGSNNTYRIPYNWEVRLFQRFLCIYILYNLDKMNRDLDINLDKTSSENMINYIDLLEYIPRKLLCLDNKELLLIWRKLRLVDYNTVHLSVGYFNTLKCKGDNFKKYLEDKSDCDKYDQCMNDKWYNYLMNYLTERLALYMNDSLLSGKNITGTLDDYYFDLKYIYYKKVHTKLNISKLVSDYGEFESLNKQIDSIIYLINNKNFELKGRILNKFTNNNYNDAYKDCNNDGYCFHQPISYGSGILSKYVNKDFETNFDNDLYYSYSPEKIYSNKTTSKLSNEYAMFDELFNNKKTVDSKENGTCSGNSNYLKANMSSDNSSSGNIDLNDNDFCNKVCEIGNSNFEGLFKLYTSLMEEERNLMLFSLNHSKKLRVSNGLGNIKTVFIKDKDCIHRIVKLRKEIIFVDDEADSISNKNNFNYREIIKFLSELILERRRKLNNKLEFLNDVVNYYSNIEILFLFNLYRISLKKLQVNIKLCDWLNYSLMIPSSSYYTLLEISNIFNPMRLRDGFAIYTLIFRISSHYAKFVCDWNKLFDNLEDCFLNKDKTFDGNRYYDVLLLYNRSKIMKILLYDFSKNNPYYNSENNLVKNCYCNNTVEKSRIEVECDSYLECEYSDNKKLHKGIKYEKEFEYKYKKTVDMYLKLRIIEFFSFQLFNDYINGVFRDITTNGLYNSNLPSNFLLYFPRSLIEQIRGIKPINSVSIGSVRNAKYNNDVETSENGSNDEYEKAELQLDVENKLRLLDRLADECDNFEYSSKFGSKSCGEDDVNSIINGIKKAKNKWSFIKDMTLVYLSKKNAILAIKYSINQKSGIFYSDTKLLFDLSREIKLNNQVLNSVYLRRMRNLYDLYYDYSRIDEHYYYYYKGVGQNPYDIHSLNNNLASFSEMFLLRISNEGGFKNHEFENKECYNTFSFAPFNFDANLADNTNNNSDGTKLELKCRPECSNILRKANTRKNKTIKECINDKRFVFIHDTIDFATNIILFRIYIKNLMSKSRLINNKYGSFNFDLAKKIAIMNYSMNEIMKNTSFVKNGKTIILDEFYYLVKEIIRLVHCLDNLKPERQGVSLMFGHYIHERELMLMEEFSSFKTISNAYFFTPFKNKEDVDILFINKIFPLSEKKTFLDVFEYLINKSESVINYIVNHNNRDSIGKFLSLVRNRKERILELEKKAEAILEIIRKDVTTNKRDDKYNLYGDTDIKVLMEKMLIPPNVSRDDIRRASYYELSKLIPNYDIIYKTYGVKPYNNYDLLMSYYDESHILDNDIHTILNKITNVDRKEYTSTFKDGDIMKMILYNIGFLEEILKLRILIIRAKIITDKLSLAYIEYFKGITRYYLVFGTRYFWGISPSEKKEMNSIKSLADDNDESDLVQKEAVFVPILGYKVIKDLHYECLVWNNVAVNGSTLGINKYCEFVALECYLSYSNYLIESLSFNKKDHINCIINDDKSSSNSGNYSINNCGNGKAGTYLSRNLLYTNFFYLEVPETELLASFMGGFVDIGEYLSEYKCFLEKEFIFKKDAFVTTDSEKCKKRALEIGSLTILRRKDNRLVYHFSGKKNFKVRYFEFDNKEDFGPLSNIFLLEKSIDRVKYKWQILPLSQPLKPNVFLFLIRKYAKQLLEFVFNYFYDIKDCNYDFIKKKDDFIYNSGFTETRESNCINLFTLVDKYLKNTVDYIFTLIFESMNFRVNEDELYLIDLSNYLSYIKYFKNKWHINSEYTSTNTKIMIELNSSSHSHHKLPSSGCSTSLDNSGSIRDRHRKRSSNIDKNPAASGITDSKSSSDIKTKASKQKSSELVVYERNEVRALKKKSEACIYGMNDQNSKKGSDIESCKKIRISEGEMISGNSEYNKSSVLDQVNQSSQRSEDSDSIGSNKKNMSKRLERHIGYLSDIKFIWLGWLNLSSEMDKNSSGNVLEVGFYQIGNQIGKKSDYILNSLEKDLNFQFTGRLLLFKDLKLDLNKSLCVLLSSNWSQNINSCEDEVFNRIFHFQYNMRNYEVFEFNLLNSEEIKLWLFPCNLDKKSSINDCKVPSNFDFPISKHYLLGIVTICSDDETKSELSDISILSTLLPNESQIFNIAEYCNKQCIKTNSKMEFLISNPQNMFSSAGTLLSNLLSLNGNLASKNINLNSPSYIRHDSPYAAYETNFDKRHNENSHTLRSSSNNDNYSYIGSSSSSSSSSCNCASNDSNSYITGYNRTNYYYNSNSSSYIGTGFSNNSSTNSSYCNSGYKGGSNYKRSEYNNNINNLHITSNNGGNNNNNTRNDGSNISTLGELLKYMREDVSKKN
ncbi:hypothetical protein RS030_162549 [Cryptosporidium xiaoi]|uniref:Uncharacterized protein n=1 Tax=Cryptosporidium xiaoi TaxID=659607 RepID=A0AAV9Y1W9_9CRYT